MERLTGNSIATGLAYYDRLRAIEDILGDEYDLNRLRELAQADREGRCVVLPCKIGDTIYQADYIEGALTIDDVPVVRCRECQWYNAGANDSESWSDCTFRYGKHFNVSPDDFCSYGQQKIETVLPKSDAKDESLEADHD